MKIIAQAGMVNIDDKDIAYSNIRNLYVEGNGYGLQLPEHLESKRDEITVICSKIANEIYALQDLLSDDL